MVSTIFKSTTFSILLKTHSSKSLFHFQLFDHSFHHLELITCIFLPYIFLPLTCYHETRKVLTHGGGAGKFMPVLSGPGSGIPIARDDNPPMGDGLD